MPSSNTNLLLPKNSRSKGKNLKSLVNTVREAVRRRPSKRRPSKRRTSRRESNNLGKLGPVPVNNLTRAPVPEHPILDTSLDEAVAREAAARETPDPGPPIAAAREAEAKPVTVNKAESSGSSFPSRSPSFNIKEWARGADMISNSNSTNSEGKKRDKKKKGKKGNRGNQSKKGKGKGKGKASYKKKK